MIHSLPLFLRLSGRTVILIGEGEAADAKRRLLLRAGAIEGALADATAARLRERGLLINVVDRPDLCDFTTPAIVDRAPVLMAIGTGGASAGLAKALRQRLEAILPSTLGALATALAARRADIRARWPIAADRRRAIDAALSEGGLLDPALDFTQERLDKWLLSPLDERAIGRWETLVMTSADPDLMTVRAARLLGMADSLCHAGDVPDAILNRARADATRNIADMPHGTPPTGLSLWLEMAP